MRPPRHSPAATSAVSRSIVRCAATVVALAVVSVASGPASEAADPLVAPSQTVNVTKRDLSTKVTVSGSLGYGDPVTINAAQSTATTSAGGASTAKTASGTTITTGNVVTALAAEGTLLQPGDTIFAVDSAPRVLMVGGQPAWRDISAATAGTDVYQLKWNLAALGYAPAGLNSDGIFDAATAAAVASWQQAHGYTPTGTVPLGQVVFLPGPARVGTNQTHIGAILRPGSAVTAVTVTDTALPPPAAGSGPMTPDATVSKVSQRRITAHLNLTDRGTVKTGDAATVTFADGSNAPAHLTSIGSVAARASNTAPPTIVVTATLDDNSSIDPNLVAAPVQLSFTKQSISGVLTVPAAALVMLDSSYAVRVIDGSSARLTPVTAGFYANGYVQISGAGITEGTKVVAGS